MSPPPRWRRLLLRASLAGLCALVLAELAVRLVGPSMGLPEERLDAIREFVLEGRTRHYEPSPHTLFRKRRGQPDINPHGFRGGDWSLEKPEGVVRIACLGGSTTERGGTDHGYPARLEELLESRTDLRFEVLNCGISCWTSAETTVAWFLLLKDYAPDLVIVHHAVNDARARGWPGYRSDYSHYRRGWRSSSYSWPRRFLVTHSDLAAWLTCPEPPTIEELTDRPTSEPTDAPPVDETARGFRRNLISIGRDVEAGGGSFALLTMPLRPPSPSEAPSAEFWREGTRDLNRHAREVAAAEGWLLIDLETWADNDPATAGPAFTDLVHTTPEGNLLRAEFVCERLLEEWVARLER